MMDVKIMKDKMEIFKSRKFILLFSIILTSIAFAISRIFPQFGDVYNVIILPSLSLIFGPIAILGFSFTEFVFLAIFHPESGIFNLLFAFFFFICNFAIWKSWYSIMNKHGLEKPNIISLYSLIKLFVVFLVYALALWILYGFMVEELIIYEFGLDIVATVSSFFIAILALDVASHFNIPVYLPTIQIKQILPKRAYYISLILFIVLGLLQTFFSNLDNVILKLITLFFLIIYLLKPYDTDISNIKNYTETIFSKVSVSIVLLIIIMSIITVLMDFVMGLGYSESYFDITITTMFLFIVMSIPLLLYLSYLEKNVINPLNKLSEIMSEDITNNEDYFKHEKKLKEIKVNNEIRVLIDSLCDMEYDMIKYGKNLVKVTSEKERYETELKLASDIQDSMIPKDFDEFHDKFGKNRNKFELGGIMKAAREVGGDFYDYFQIDEDNIGFVIGDVSGKGISAALIMVKAMTLIQDYTKEYKDLSKAFYEANNGLSEENVENHFVTCWLGKINLKTYELSFVNAGHNPPLIKLNGNDFDYMEQESGLVLAAMGDMPYKTHTIQLAKGDTIFLYTDGVTEANDNYKEFYGEEKLKNIINKHKYDNVNTIIKSIEEDVKEFCNYEEQFDDITMFIIRVK